MVVHGKQSVLGVVCVCLSVYRPCIHWNFQMGPSEANEPCTDINFRLYPQVCVCVCVCVRMCPLMYATQRVKRQVWIVVESYRQHSHAVVWQGNK